MGIDAEPLELGPGGRAARPDVDASVGEEVEHGDGLGRPHGMVVVLGHEAHAVPDPDPLGARRHRAVEDLGVRAVRELGEEVVLDRPEGVPSEAVTGDGLLQRVLISA